jgi:hypothetical protein
MIVNDPFRCQHHGLMSEARYISQGSWGPSSYICLGPSRRFPDDPGRICGAVVVHEPPPTTDQSIKKALDSPFCRKVSFLRGTEEVPWTANLTLEHPDGDVILVGHGNSPTHAVERALACKLPDRFTAELEATKGENNG